ncbi:MAG: HlyC/CorC family transporter [Phycisphaerae bacterium]|nr:HlyC/CorC family transporter [Phycisphaerae bacterium]
MTATDLTLLVTLPALLVLSAGCSSAETALFSLNGSDRAALRKVSRRSASAATTLLARPRALLVTVLLGNIAVNTAYMAVASLLATKLEGAAAQAGAGAAAVGGLILFGEVLPKVLATANRIRFARVLAPLVLLLDRAVAPVRAVVDRGMVGPATRLLRPAGAPESHPLTVGELSGLLETAQSQGVFGEDEQELLGEVLDLGRRRVRDVMIPRVDMAWVDEAFTGEEVLEAARRTGHGLLPVRSKDGQVAGLLNARRYLAARLQRRTRGVGGDPAAGEFMEAASFVPDRARLDQLLGHFRGRADYVAICVDERGEVTGLVRLEDMVRELIDAPREGPGGGEEGVKEVAEGVWLVSGRLNVHDWEDYFESTPSEPLDRRVRTMAGLVLSKLGRVPKEGDSVRLGNVEMRVEAMRGRRIESVRVSVTPGASAGVSS